jgi:hypothetical protein
MNEFVEKSPDASETHEEESKVHGDTTQELEIQKEVVRKILNILQTAVESNPNQKP